MSIEIAWAAGLSALVASIVTLLCVQGYLRVHMRGIKSQFRDLEAECDSQWTKIESYYGRISRSKGKARPVLQTEEPQATDVQLNLPDNPPAVPQPAIPDAPPGGLSRGDLLVYARSRGIAPGGQRQ